MAQFSLAWRALHVPKEGHTPEEYEDAWAGDPDRGRFAVADGASESAFARSWANLLVTSYVQTPGPWSRWLPPARGQWQAEAEKRELPWWAETKVEEGAFPALLGLAFHGDRWVAQAVGDCCLFQIRNGRLLRAFPIRRASDFGNRPSLLGSQRRQPGQARTRRFRLRGRCRLGDGFYLMTDALAQWFLQKTDQQGSPWLDLDATGTEEEFARWLAKLRGAKEIHNDDVTLLRVLL